jgi:hypothetical protein
MAMAMFGVGGVLVCNRQVRRLLQPSSAEELVQTSAFLDAATLQVMVAAIGEAERHSEQELHGWSL